MRSATRRGLASPNDELIGWFRAWMRGLRRRGASRSAAARRARSVVNVCSVSRLGVDREDAGVVVRRRADRDSCARPLPPGPVPRPTGDGRRARSPSGSGRPRRWRRGWAPAVGGWAAAVRPRRRAGPRRRPAGAISSTDAIALLDVVLEQLEVGRLQVEDRRALGVAHDDVDDDRRRGGREAGAWAAAVRLRLGRGACARAPTPARRLPRRRRSTRAPGTSTDSCVRLAGWRLQSTV